MTLKDIAKECNVSVMTVSNVITGKHSKVSENTIKKVNDTIKKTGYVPNLSARALSSKASHIVLLVIPYIEDEDSTALYSQYLTRLVSTIERELIKNNYYVMLHSVYDPAEIEVMYKTWNIDGTIFLLPFFDNTFWTIKDYEKKHFVLIDSYSNVEGVGYVRCDDQQGCYLSTKHLIENGHTNIAFAAEYENNPLLSSRRKGYLQAMEEYNLKPHTIKIVPDYNGGLSLGINYPSSLKDITAVVTTSDMCALGIIEGVTAVNGTFPKDFSITGFDNLPVCNYSSPKLTSIDQNINDKGKKAVSLLLNSINGIEDKKIEVTDVSLVIRNSVTSI